MAVELNKSKNVAHEHLLNGRFRLALTEAEKIFKDNPQDAEAAIYYAWALLENGHPAEAMEYSNIAVELDSSIIKTRLYRGYLLMRMSIFEGAIADFDSVIDRQKQSLSWSYVNKAKALAGLGHFEEARMSMELGMAIDDGKTAELKNCMQWYKVAEDLTGGTHKITHKNFEEYLEMGNKALADKEFWFSLKIARDIIENEKIKVDKYEAKLLELEAMYKLFQLRPALKKAEELKDELPNNKRYKNIVRSINKALEEKPPEIEKEEEEFFIPPKTAGRKPAKKTEKVITPKAGKTEASYYANDDLEAFSIKMFDVVEDKETGKRNYYKQFNNSTVAFVGAEMIFNNPFFKMADKNFPGQAVWYLNDFEIARNNFNIKVSKDWDSIMFVQTLGTQKPGSWDKGQGKVEIFLQGFKVCEKYFILGNEPVLEIIEKPASEKAEQDETEQVSAAPADKQEETDHVQEPEERKSLEELVADLETYTGLESIKKGVKDFINYLKFINERKKAGLKAKDDVSINAVFLGNPGTGKTTIARLMGNILREMGIIEKGHVVEVDRAAMVGQYVGETAQKTEKLIEDAMGGVLFIDEAYTLIKKGGGGQDFGQEAIDILLKRMEDQKGEFTVIAAGYPEEMNDFMASNPGLKSRFTHSFTFEDYTPDELFEILNINLEKEEYTISDEASELIKKQFMKLYRDRDQTFGNARLVRQLFEDVKINLGKRFLELPEEERTTEAMTSILPADIEAAFAGEEEKDVLLPINEEALAESLKQLNSLTGLASVKKEVNNMIKLARYYMERGEDAKSKFNSHILFLGNPGTGKTTVARIIGKIYAALGILPKGHLIETDRQGLVAGYVGQTAEKTTAVIEKAIGGTLFVDEAYALVTEGGGQDFGKEAIDTLLKRMEDDRGKFIVIAAGYTDNMDKFIKSNPGMQSRFNRSFNFEDYNPDELMTITKASLKSKKLSLSEKAEQALKIYYEHIYKTRDKNFGNARIVRNLITDAQQKLLLRVAETPADERTEELEKMIMPDDIDALKSPAVLSLIDENGGGSEKLDSLLEELDNIIGIEKVKKKIESTISSLKLSQVRKQRGLKVIEKNLHTIFIGKSGTGKKKVAKLLGQIYKALGIIDKGHFVEVDRSDLVAGYSGQTSVKTEQAIEKAMGGILFVNNADSLLHDTNDYGYEAVETMFKKMDELRNKLVIIFSGHPAAMKKIIEHNSSLQAQFGNYFIFDDFTPRQLLEIMGRYSEENGYNLDEGALQLSLEIFNTMYEERDNSFGNAHLAVNIFYKAISYQEERIASFDEHSDEALTTINFDDVSRINLKEF